LKDTAATIFNLTQEREFKNKGTGKEIRCHKSNGPNFAGSNNSDLGVTREPFNGNGKCYSWVNKPGYGIPEEGGKNMLTN
jgi:hypothetical protein